jgi:hypothetical protein
MKQSARSTFSTAIWPTTNIWHATNILSPTCGIAVLRPPAQGLLYNGGEFLSAQEFKNLQRSRNVRA